MRNFRKIRGYIYFNMVLDQTANMSVCFHDQKKSALHLNIHNRHDWQTTFSGQKLMADL